MSIEELRRAAFDSACREVDELRAENERLRAFLRKERDAILRRGDGRELASDDDEARIKTIDALLAQGRRLAASDDKHGGAEA